MIFLSFLDIQFIQVLPFRSGVLAQFNYYKVQQFEFRIITYNIFQQQSMLNKPIGTIHNKEDKNIGKLYQTQQFNLNSQNQPQTNNQLHQNQLSQSYKKRNKRTNSVGKIYSRKSSINRDCMDKDRDIMNRYDKVINYNEMQHKLSKFLQCSINTTHRPKYNYLFQHYNNPGFHHKYSTNYKYHGFEQRQINDKGVYKYQSDYTPLQRKDSNQNIIGYEKEANILKWQRTPIIQLKMSTRQQSEKKSERISQIKQQKFSQRQSSPRKQKKLQRNSDHKSQKKIQKSESLTKKLQFSIHNKQNCIPISIATANKKQIFPVSNKKQMLGLANKKQNLYNMAGRNHNQHKNQLQMKLKKIINNYENKNKQLSMEMHKIEEKTIAGKKQQNKDSQTNNEQKQNLKIQDPPFSEDIFKQAIDKLIQYNLKAICLSKECDPKLQEIWKSLHKQIVADQNLRIIKTFINQNNIDSIIKNINDNRIKKIQNSAFKTHSQEYDPFLLEKINEALNISNPNFTHRLVIKWISETFVKYYDDSQRNWIKNLSQQKMQCYIKLIYLQKQINGLRKNEGISKDLIIRDFTRYLSIIFKANLRNRNIYQIYNKLKDMTFKGRFIQLLQQKAGKGGCPKKSLGLPK